jgi:formate dehydrogenase subunit gamma
MHTFLKAARGVSTAGALSVLVLLLLLGSALGFSATVTAQDKAAASPPAGFVAPALPSDKETNEQRGKSQPGNNAPFWRGVRDSGEKPGFTTLPGVEKGVLVQPFTQYPGSKLSTAGEAWRQVRNGFIIPYGGALLLLAVASLALMYFTKGAIGGHVPDTGRKFERFTPFERTAHWANAIAWVVLAVSGIVMAFGKFFLLPVIGSTLFGYLTYALKTTHNLVGPVFAVSLVVVFITFVKDNFPRAGDLRWLLNLGGMFSKDGELPSHRFNAGEKVLFWGGVFFLGAVVIGSGLVADQLIPWVDVTRGNMQIALMVHGISTALMMAMFLGHIYLGTIGTKGAYQGMRTGYVDEGWGLEHHKHWAEDVRAGRIPAQRSPVAPTANHDAPLGGAKHA